MNAQRAAEIASSPVMVRVTYDNRPVYIQHVDEAAGTARIYALDRPEDEWNVPIRQLEEDSAEFGSMDAPLACPSTDSAQG